MSSPRGKALGQAAELAAVCGNGVQHTLYKVGQFATGYVLCLTVLKMREARFDPESL